MASVRILVQRFALKQRYPTDSRDVASLGAALIVAAIPRFLLAPTLGYRYDLQEYVSWGFAMVSHPWQQAYSLTDSNYPPLLMYFWGAWIKLYITVAHILQRPAGADLFTFHSIAAFSRLPFDLADLAMVFLVWLIARAKLSARSAFVVASLYALTPALLLDGPLWGQTDGINALLVVGAILFAIYGRPALAGLILGMAVAFKLMPVEYAPLLLVFIWYRSGTGRGARFLKVAGFSEALAVVVLASFLPYLLFAPGQLSILVARVMWAAAGTQASASAYNVWWLLGMATRPSSAALLGPLTFSKAGVLLVLVCIVIACVLIARTRTPSALFLGAGLVAMATYMCSTGQHERYIYPAIPCFVFAALYERRMRQSAMLWAYYAVASAMMFLNHAMIIATLSAFESPPSFLDLTAAHAYLVQHQSLTDYVAAVNVALFVAMIANCVYRGLKEGLHQETMHLSARYGTAGEGASTEDMLAGYSTQTGLGG